jgi:hypothetical protein
MVFLRSSTKWYRWFAWYPVTAQEPESNYLVWLSKCWRRDGTYGSSFKLNSEETPKS